MTSEHITAALSVAVRPDHLQPVIMERLDIPKALERQIKAKQCYRNAVIVAAGLSESSAVVLGVTVLPAGIGIEHCWVKMENGQHFDPTFQTLFESEEEVDGSKYYAMLEIPVTEYSDLAEQLHVGKRAICFADIRRSKLYRHLFIRNHQERSELLKIVS